MSKKEKMKKKLEIDSSEVEQSVMDKILHGEISMKPRWYFLLGSFLMFLGLVGSSIGAIFLTNLSIFLFRQHGPMGQVKLQLMLTSFPWWVPVFALLSIMGGIILLKKYDFSYRKNPTSVIVIFVLAILLASMVIELTGINDTWLRRGSMRRLYQQRGQGNSWQYRR